jgi:hypothetical protein
MERRYVMATATISQQELQQNYAAAEEATHSGPVFITRDGEPRCVLIDVASYRKLSPVFDVPPTAEGKPLSELLAMPDEDYFEWEPPRLLLSFEPADLS